jgi:hypothetical protein
MKTPGQATFSTRSWDEKAYVEIDDGRKLTRIHIVQTYTGDMDGVGTSESLMAYTIARTASGVGLEQFEGSIGGKTGTCIVQHASTFEYPVAKDSWFVVPGSATGDLKGLRAEGISIMEGQRESYTTEFTYEFVDEASAEDTNRTV